jgi:hypothetical protein
LIVKSVSVFAAAQRAGLVLVCELLAGQASKGAKDCRPMAACCF